MIWRVVDGKRGHERQTQGLVQALSQLLPVAVVDVRCEPRFPALWHWLAGTFPAGADLAAPDLIVGAGHGTHLTMLAARRARGGRTVVLMKPSLPLRGFDLCLVPEHDEVKAAPNVLMTRGAINAVQPSREKDADTGLILLGGVSAHYRWDDERVLEQVRRLVVAEAETDWTLTTSPRTPESMLSRLRELKLENLAIAPFENVASDWLPAQMERAAQVWVTPDSVSMVYEALTSGAAVGLFELDKAGSSRVAQGVAGLLAERRVSSYSDWLAGNPPRASMQEFNEAARCARWIKDNWFPDR